MTDIQRSQDFDHGLRVAAGSASRATVLPDLASALVLIAAVVLLAFTAPHDGEFWWSDAPRHALNGVFLTDLLHDLPHPARLQEWAMNYYLQYPALTILFYPPLFPAVEAVGYLLFGVSHATAAGCVAVLYAALALGAHALARRWLDPVQACACALLLVGFSEVAFWGRQVMTEIPAFAFLVWSAVCILRAADRQRPGFLYAGAALILAAAYTKLTVVFILPVFLGVLVAGRGVSVLRDRHSLIAGALFGLGMLPLVLLTWKFGQANIQSVSGVADAAASRASLDGWLFYLKLLPQQIGTLPLTLAAVGLVISLFDRSERRAGQALLFLGGWFILGYLFFSAISLKESRHTVFLLYPLAFFAVVGAARCLPSRPAGLGAGTVAMAVAAGNLAWTLAFAPAPAVEGYAQAARWIQENTPPGRVLFSGQRDGSFIFTMRALDAERRYAVVRADKLLLNVAVRRELGVTEKGVDGDGILRMLHDYAVPYVVAERDFWTDLHSMQTFQALLDSELFTEVARFPVEANQPHTDRELRIYRLTEPVAAEPQPLRIDLPIISRTFNGTPAKDIPAP